MSREHNAEYDGRRITPLFDLDSSIFQALGICNENEAMLYIIRANLLKLASVKKRRDKSTTTNHKRARLVENDDLDTASHKYDVNNSSSEDDSLLCVDESQKLDIAFSAVKFLSL